MLGFKLISKSWPEVSSDGIFPQGCSMFSADLAKRKCCTLCPALLSTVLLSFRTMFFFTIPLLDTLFSHNRFTEFLMIVTRISLCYPYRNDKVVTILFYNLVTTLAPCILKLWQGCDKVVARLSQGCTNIVTRLPQYTLSQPCIFKLW